MKQTIADWNEMNKDLDQFSATIGVLMGMGIILGLLSITTACYVALIAAGVLDGFVPAPIIVVVTAFDALFLIFLFPVSYWKWKKRKEASREDVSE